MYSLTKKVISVLLITAIVVLSISTAIASSFDDIMNLPDYEETGNSSDYLEFDDFLVDFQYYCKSWQASFNTSKKQSKTLEDGSIVLQLDGVTFWLKVTDDRHEITQIAVKLGDPQNAYKADYSMLVKVYALIATLDYKKPNTSAERSSVLSSVMADFQQNVEPAVKYAQTLGSFPVVFNNSHYSYAVTFSEDEGYDFIAVITDTKNSDIPEKQSEAQPDDTEKIPIEITGIKMGKEASFRVKNNKNETLTEISFRVRYLKDGEYILTDDAASYSVNPQISTFTVSIDDGGLIKNQSIVLDTSDLTPFVNADEVDIAVSGYKQEDGVLFASTEPLLYWYSSNDGYPDKRAYGFSNQNYFDEWFAEGKKFSLGIYVEQIYPEYMSYFGVDQCGYLITEIVEGSISEQKGIKVGDILYACNDIKWYDDPNTIDRAKYYLTEGKDMTISLLRGSETITVTISPSDISD